MMDQQHSPEKIRLTRRDFRNLDTPKKPPDLERFSMKLNALFNSPDAKKLKGRTDRKRLKRGKRPRAGAAMSQEDILVQESPWLTRHCHRSEPPSRNSEAKSSSEEEATFTEDEGVEFVITTSSDETNRRNAFELLTTKRAERLRARRARLTRPMGSDASEQDLKQLEGVLPSPSPSPSLIARLDLSGNVPTDKDSSGTKSPSSSVDGSEKPDEDMQGQRDETVSSTAADSAKNTTTAPPKKRLAFSSFQAVSATTTRVRPRRPSPVLRGSGSGTVRPAPRGPTEEKEPHADAGGDIKGRLVQLGLKASVASADLRSRVRKMSGQSEGLPVDASLAKRLHPYQIDGIRWLYLLHRDHPSANGILGDEMGLGKTVQVIALIQMLKGARKGDTECDLPFLVVAPNTTLENWGREFQMWAPDISVLQYYGSMADRQELAREYIPLRGRPRDLPDVILTTYSMVFAKADGRFFRKMRFSYLVCDEAQNLKNASSVRYNALTQVHSTRRLLLTGSPLQNNLGELWALLMFLNPNIFDGMEGEEYESPARALATLDGTSVVPVVRKILSLFMMRRTKAEVLTWLPEKTSHTIVVPMTDSQRSLYTDLDGSSASQSDLASENDNKIGMMLMQLRKAADSSLLFRTLYTETDVIKLAETIAEQDLSVLEHVNEQFSLVSHKTQLPRVTAVHLADFLGELSDFALLKLCVTTPVLRRFKLNESCLIQSSGKLAKLAELVKKYKRQRLKIVVYSQLVIFLDIVEHFLNQTQRIRTTRLDGNTPTEQRQGIMDVFAADDKCPVILLSTRAGGVGVNLTCANVVIFMDNDYNPSIDLQAEDRCHRIGQANPVTVFHLVSGDTIDLRVRELAEGKASFNKSVLNDDAVAVREAQKKLAHILSRKE